MTDTPHITDAELIDSASVEISATEQKQIDKAIAELKKSEVAKVNKTDIAISEMQAKYMAIQISGTADREAYLVASDGYKIVRSHRLAVERKRKELVEFPNRYLKEVNGEATRIKELLTPIEAHLKLQVGVYEQAEAAEKERLAQERRTKLTEAGFKFDGHFYVCGMHTISTTQLADMAEDTLAYYVKEAQAIVAAEKAAEERRLAAIQAQQEAAAKLEADRKALEAQKAEFARQQAEQNIAMEKMRAELEAMKAQLNPKVEPATVEAVTAQPNTTVEVKTGGPGHNAGIPEGLKAYVTERPAPTPLSVIGDAIATKVDADMTAAIKAPAHMETADQVDKAIAESGQTADYVAGFEDCKLKVLAIFADPTPRKRGEFVEAIKLIKP